MSSKVAVPSVPTPSFRAAHPKPLISTMTGLSTVIQSAFLSHPVSFQLRVLCIDVLLLSQTFTIYNFVDFTWLKLTNTFRLLSCFLLFFNSSPLTCLKFLFHSAFAFSFFFPLNSRNGPSLSRKYKINANKVFSKVIMYN